MKNIQRKKLNGSTEFTAFAGRLRTIDNALNLIIIRRISRIYLKYFIKAGA